MNRHFCLFLLFLACSALGGCAGPRYVKEGDAWMTAGQPDRALASYRKALEKKADLSEEPAFLEKLEAARSASLYLEARALMEEERWDTAISRLEESLEVAPDFEQARSALAEAQRGASRAHYRRALERADEGRLNEAIDELKQALELDPGNLDARDALDSVTEEKRDTQSKARGLYDAAQTLAGEKRWLACSTALEEAVAADLNHLPSRVALYEAKEALRTARELLTTGQTLLEGRDLDRSIQAIESSLATWPHHQEAQAALAEAQELRQQAEEAYLQGAGLFEEQRWDEALVSLEQARAIFPAHADTVELLVVVRARAASAHCDRADAHLRQGELDEAEAAYRFALGYARDFARAHSGLGRVHHTRGLAFEDQGLWGNALLSYLEAADHDATPEVTDKAAWARAMVLERVRFGLALVSHDLSQRRSPSFESGLAYRLTRSAPSCLVVTEGESADAQYLAEVALISLDVSLELESSQNRVQRFTVYRDVHNPELERVLGSLDRAKHELDQLRRLSQRRCPVCAGRRVVTCGNCRGTGVVSCRPCGGTGKVDCKSCRGTGHKDAQEELGPCPQCGGTGKQVCTKCRGEGSHRCAICRGSGRVKCPSCDGRGQGTPALSTRVSRQERVVRDLEREVRRTPTTVRRAFPADWPYVRSTYGKRADLVAQCAVTDRADGRIILSRTVEKWSSELDTTIEGANPSIGLFDDPLQLPSDDTLCRSVLDQAVSELAHKISTAVVEAKLAQAYSRAEALTRAGETAAALEAYADYLCMLEQLNPDEASEFRKSLSAKLL